MKTAKENEHLRKIRDDIELFLDAQLKGQVRVVLPYNLRKSKLIAIKPNELNNDKWLSGCYHIIHTIIQLRFDKRYANSSWSYVPLSSVILKKILGNSYRTIFIDNLIESGIIECDGKYSIVRHESFGFRLASRYRDKAPKKRTIIDPDIRRTILRFRIQILVIQKSRLREIAHLTRWLTYGKLQIDKDGALEYLELYKRRMQLELEKRNLHAGFLQEKLSFINFRYLKAKYQVESWGEDPHISVDDAGGRLYSPVSSLMSPLRNFLTYDGEPLVSFDIKNSQPLHFLLLMQPKFWKKGTDKYSLCGLDENLYDNIKNQERISPFIMFHRIYESAVLARSMNPKFKLLVQNGKLYEFISEKFTGKFKTLDNIDRFNTRNKTKQEVLHLMYFNPNAMYSKAALPFQSFSILFPREAAVMNLIKKRDYRDLPILLQKVEAQVLLHTVCKKVYDINPDIPLITVHDSVITTSKYADLLKTVLTDTYSGLLGFIPKFEREEFNPLNADQGRKKYVNAKIDQADIETSPQVEPVVPERIIKLRRFTSGKHK